MATYYINADSGDNANAGTSASPWETLAYAYDNSSAGDTVHAQEATATYDFVDDTIVDRTIEGEGIDATVFDGGGDGSATTTSYWEVRGTVEIKNLTIQNVDTQADRSTLNTYRTNSITLTVTGVRFTGIYGHSNVLEAGVISGFRATVGVHTFTSCIFDDLTQENDYYAGVFTARDTNSGCSITMNNCVFYQETVAKYCNNVVTTAYTDGNLTVSMKNNIFSNESGQPVNILYAHGSVPAGDIPTTFSNNNYYDNYSFDSNQFDMTMTDNITSDPLFIDATNGDFRLRPTSPCIDTGTTV